jgi:hypothetical protein
MGQVRLAQACGAPDYLVCIVQCPVARLARPTNRLLSRKLSAPRLKFTRLSGVSSDYPVSPWPTGDCHQVRNVKRSETVREVGRTGLLGMPPDYPVRHRGRLIQRSVDVAGTGQ